MRRIGILTFHFADNYGAVLQAYGLITYLRQSGVDAHIINYYPSYVTHGGCLKLPISFNNIKANLIILYQKYIQIKKLFVNDNGVSKKYKLFRKRYLHIENHHYKTLNSLRVAPPDADIYITGSDQVWNPSGQFGVDPAYYLDFGRVETRRASYAASFGRDDVPSIYYPDILRLVSNIDVVSVREISGVDLLKKIAEVDVKWMPDPTILLDSYDEICEKPHDMDPYMFSYVLRGGDGIPELQAHIAEKLGIRIVTPYNPMKRWKTMGETIYPGPEQWLGYIKHASFIVTNSFHGVVFSIIFNKPFICIGLTGNKGGLNERAKSLLSRLGLEHCMLTSFSEHNADELLSQIIDWNSVNLKLQEWRVEAHDFIKKEILNI